MRIAVMIIALCLVMILGLQSCMVTGLSGMVDNQEAAEAGAYGIFLAFLFVIGAAFSLRMPIVSAVVFLVGGAIGLIGGQDSAYKDLVVWSSISIVLGIMSLMAVRGQRRDGIAAALTARPGAEGNQRGSSRLDDLDKLAGLRARGALSEFEFETEKAKLLRSETQAHAGRWDSIDWSFLWGGIPSLAIVIGLLWILLSFGGERTAPPPATESQPTAASDDSAVDVVEPSEDSGPQFIESTYNPDPKLLFLPTENSSLRASAAQQMELEPDMECTASQECYQKIDDQVTFHAPPLISVRRTLDQSLGGVHGMISVSDKNFLAGTEVRFGDLFTSWPAAKPIIQQAFCAKLMERLAASDADMEGVECPNIDNTALTFEGENGITGISVSTSDYQLGFYAIGRAQEVVPVTPALVTLLRPELKQLVAAQ